MSIVLFLGAGQQDVPLKYRIFFTLDMFCGYRREELCVSKWDDIDFDRRAIAVNRASLYSKDRGIYTDIPKTERSRRIIRQSEIVFDVLKKLRAEQAEQQLSLGDQWQGSGRVFTTWNGGAMYQNTPYAWLKKHCKKHGFRFPGVHAFRRLNAALLIDTGADAQTVAADLGHSQVSTTLNIYACEFAEAKAVASEAVASVLTAKLKKKAQSCPNRMHFLINSKPPEPQNTKTSGVSFLPRPDKNFVSPVPPPQAASSGRSPVKHPHGARRIRKAAEPPTAAQRVRPEREEVSPTKPEPSAAGPV